MPGQERRVEVEGAARGVEELGGDDPCVVGQDDDVRPQGEDPRVPRPLRQPAWTAITLAPP